MDSDSVSPRLLNILSKNLDPGQQKWLGDRIALAVENPSGKDLFLTYSLIGRKIPGRVVPLPENEEGELGDYLRSQGIRADQLARIYLLAAALESDPGFYIPKVSTLIQVADTGELETFLRFLPVLPQSGKFKSTAVEALRTNIATVFDAITLNNPYPSANFDQQQWNQMYLKAAFMGRDLLAIRGVEDRANADLARIISDYAHERWAASRPVDPVFWRPVGRFLSGPLLSDMERLLKSQDIREQMAGYLCCRAAGSTHAETLIRDHSLNLKYAKKPFDWEDLKN